MSREQPVVAPVLRRRALQLGRPGREWLDRLPDLVAELERAWSITVLEALSGGSAAYVARARTADGRDVVIKLSLPDDDFAGQVRTLRTARGQGYVHLLAQDDSRHAAMLEALGSSLEDLALPPEQTIAILCDMLRQAWLVPGGRRVPAPREEEKAAQLGRMVARLWETLGRPGSPQVVDQALRFARRRAAAFDLRSCVVVHGDPHPGNALRVPSPRLGAESGFVFVDPDGFLADPAYDLGVVLRDRCAELLAGDARLLARRYCRMLADRTGVAEHAIWEWGFLERVSTGLYLCSLGAEDAGRLFLETAERLL